MIIRIGIYLAIAALLGTCQELPPQLEQVKTLGELRVVTRNSPTAYYIGVNGPVGPEYDLVKGFADSLGVELKITAVESFDQILPTIAAGEAHMAAAGLSVTESRKERVQFSIPYHEVTQHLIYRLGTGKPRSVEELTGGRIAVMAGSSHVETLESLQQDVPALDWSEERSAEVADLLMSVAADEIDYTVADSTDFNIIRNYHPELRVALDLEMADPIAWAFPADADDSLVEAANRYLRRTEQGGRLARILERYYGHTDKFDYVGTRAFMRHFERRLPRYREMFEEAADENAIDWRLLAAMGYQESHWRPGAVSPTGVRGIMMLTEATADYLGIEDRVDPESSISGGARFLRRLKQRLPDSIKEPDRTWMSLAAYNVGYGHLMDARRIVEIQGGNPDAWIDVSETLPLLAQRKWYSRLMYGYARGWEPVLYVENVRTYLDILRWLTEREQREQERKDGTVLAQGDGEEAPADEAGGEDESQAAAVD
ncbi:MAG TPA: membrane-bound lytic murein transglycosylase MltF [Woeseiaceae bacterium]|nr:membrane-bound lytic murein transglycosylase MltF [Woeseiaceae bacterium]